MNEPKERSLTGRWVRLVPVTGASYEFLFALATDSRVSYRWRYRGWTPSPEQFVRSLWDGVVAQYLLVRVDTGKPVGVVIAYNVNHRERYCYVGACFIPEQVGSGWPLEGAVIFLKHLFKHWDLRKVYLETPAFNLSQFASGVGTWMHQEGTLREHEFYDNKYWDVHVLAIYRQDLNLMPDLMGEEAGEGHSQNHDLELGEFFQRVATLANVPVEELSLASRLIDLRVDSLATLELCINLSGGVENDVPPDVVTVGDLYSYYCEVQSHS